MAMNSAAAAPIEISLVAYCTADQSINQLKYSPSFLSHQAAWLRLCVSRMIPPPPCTCGVCGATAQGGYPCGYPSRLHTQFTPTSVHCPGSARHIPQIEAGAGQGSQGHATWKPYHLRNDRSLLPLGHVRSLVRKWMATRSRQTTCVAAGIETPSCAHRTMPFHIFFSYHRIHSPDTSVSLST